LRQLIWAKAVVDVELLAGFEAGDLARVDDAQAVGEVRVRESCVHVVGS